MVGRENAKSGATRIFQAFQYPVLNAHLAYSILDDIVIALVPEIDGSGVISGR